MKLTDISSRLGLSVSTVSRALRNAEGVDSETRTRVLAEAARAGYRGPGRQNPARSGKPRTVLALSLNDAVSISQDAMAGMSQAAIDLNVSILTHQAQLTGAESILNPKLQPPAMRAGQLDGIVLMSGWPNSIAADLQRLLPVVSMLHDYPACDMVGLDEWEGMKTLAAHLEGMRPGPTGYFEIRGRPTGPTRLMTAFHAVREAQPAVEIEHQEPSSGLASSPGAREFSSHVKAGVRTWICADTRSAEVLEKLAQSLGLTVPEDVMGAIFYPSQRQASPAKGWPCLKVPSDELGIAAVRRLLHRIEHPAEPIRRILLQAGLAARETLPDPI